METWNSLLDEYPLNDIRLGLNGLARPGKSGWTVRTYNTEQNRASPNNNKYHAQEDLARVSKEDSRRRPVFILKII